MVTTGTKVPIDFEADDQAFKVFTLVITIGFLLVI